MPNTINTLLVGLGNVNRNFLKILEMKAGRLQDRYGLEFRVIGLADSSGVSVDPAGFDPAQIRRFKENGGRVSDLAGHQPEWSPAEVMAELDCRLILEASPVNLKDGEPGLSVTRAALQRGISVVLANKGPLVLAFDELHRLAAETGAGLAFSATVCGALPVVNLGRRDLIAADIGLVRGIFNSTSNFILSEMAEGRDYAEALREAQQRGIAETDPSLDVEGWDTANKLVIIANSFLGFAAKLADIKIEGITRLRPTDLQAALGRNQVIKLIATAEAASTGYHLRVEPVALPQEDFLARCNGWEMGVEIHSDLYGQMFYKNRERGPLPTAAAMLRDAVNLFRDEPRDYQPRLLKHSS